MPSLASKGVDFMAAAATVRMVELEPIDLSKLNAVYKQYMRLRTNVFFRIAQHVDGGDDAGLAYPAEDLESCVRECSYTYAHYRYYNDEQRHFDSDAWEEDVRATFGRSLVGRMLERFEDILLNGVVPALTRDIMPKLLHNSGIVLARRWQSHDPGAVYTADSITKLHGMISKVVQSIEKITDLKKECLHRIAYEGADVYYERRDEDGADDDVDYGRIFNNFKALFDRSSFWRDVSGGQEDELGLDRLMHALEDARVEKVGGVRPGPS
jgi:hypothetical protein